MSEHVREAEAFLAEHWRPGVDPEAWRELVVDERWAALRWPSQWYGRDLTDDQAKDVEAVFRAAGAPGPGQDVYNLWAGTMLAFGSDELKAQFMRPLLLDQVAMCLLYSEPGAGSDLAAVRTTAVRDGEEWVVNGQKVWTSGARAADYGMLIARTDWDQPKHRGITFFWLPMRQQGVEVRPLRQATGDARFNEVFITEARVPDTHRLGELNKGWWVLQTALAYERATMGVSRRGGESGGVRGATATAHGEIPVADISLVKAARAAGKTGDPAIRQALMRLHCMRTVNDWNGERAKAVAKAGGSSPLASLGKLAMAQILHYAGRVHGHILGMDGTLDGDQNPAARDANYSQLNAYFFSIGGGTDQIQRNIIGERILGLPKEPEVDREMPFRDVPAAGRS
ncbi:MAG: acyl-CoA dehydrogenase family protein [Acidimicrobiaceae bacterium]|nr:acyl-CoA dehydrogenase family protein [Acidimicrobiaceae bacterium]MCO5329580.1 acyl-CoA dehydrogenase family protein [Ilumatobacteraceae bacterium]